MKPSFSNLEVLKFAISLEAGGIDFYEDHAKDASGNIKALFLKLADDERKHAAYFQKLYDESVAEEGQFDYMFDETVVSFFDSYAKSEGFSRDEAVINSVEDAIKVAVETEVITIDFYKDLKEHAKGKTAETLDKLIVEESEHRDALKALLD